MARLRDWSLIDDPSLSGITGKTTKIGLGTSGIGPWSDAFAPGAYGQTLSTSGIGPWKSGKAYGSALKGAKAAKGLSGAQKANLWSMGLNFAAKLFDKSKRGQPGVSNAPQLMASIQPNLDWMQFFKGKA